MKKSLSGLVNLCRREQGSVLILWALLLPVAIGMIGLGVETGTWYVTKRKLQAAADAAAISGAYENSYVMRASSANGAIVRNGFGTGSHVTVTVNNPPSTGTYTSNNNAVEVLLSQPQSLLFANLFLSSSPAIAVRAVALKQTVSTAGGCVLALAGSGTGITIIGNATLNMPNCVLVSNSTNATSINISGNSNTNVSTLYTEGGYSQGGSSTLTTATTPITNGSATADPYQNFNTPSYSGCDQNGYSTHDTVTLSPGVYCNGITLNAHANVTLSPGTYIVDRGSFNINGQATLTGTGVTIVLTSSTGSNYADIDINGGATVSLSAPTSGTNAGLAFYQDRNASAGISDTFNGGSTMDITGAIYMPTADVTFNGGNSTGGSCTQIVAETVDFSGNNKLKSNCPSGGLIPITTNSAGSIKLEE